MSATARLGIFAVGLIAAFGAAFGLGRVVGPVGDDGRAPAPAPGSPGDHRSETHP